MVAPVVEAIADVPDVVWGAIVTGIFLSGQQLLNNRREDRRRTEDATERAKDRTHQATEAREERAHQAALAQSERDDSARRAREAAVNARIDLWRDERREAHLLVLPLFEEGLKLVRDGLAQLRKADEDEDLPRQVISCITNELKDAITKAVATVQIIGSENSRACATACRDHLFRTDVEIWVSSIVAKKHAPVGLAGLTQQVLNVANSLSEYIGAVRLDLGTTD
ncbi:MULTISPECIES: hypothetical protein [unclassified Nocardioides]|uniref:hypothetical protein n=1 Tax=unclassified Nocardioides TaxID=2615069 RepID=UPI0030142703